MCLGSPTVDLDIRDSPRKLHTSLVWAQVLKSNIWKLSNPKNGGENVKFWGRYELLNFAQMCTALYTPGSKRILLFSFDCAVACCSNLTVGVKCVLRGGRLSWIIATRLLLWASSRDRRDPRWQIGKRNGPEPAVYLYCTLKIAYTRLVAGVSAVCVERRKDFVTSCCWRCWQYSAFFQHISFVFLQVYFSGVVDFRNTVYVALMLRAWRPSVRLSATLANCYHKCTVQRKKWKWPGENWQDRSLSRCHDMVWNSLTSSRKLRGNYYRGI